MIQLSNIGKEYPDKILFRDLNLFIGKASRIGLVGANGSGKTTLLRLIMGQETPDRGAVQIDRNVSLGYLPQEIRYSSDKSILVEVLDELPEIARLESAIENLSAEISRQPDNESLLERLGKLQSKFEQLDGWSVESRAKRVLAGLGFSNAKMHAPLESFSGGWRMRVALAKILFREPDILLLDEPTNHLDLESLIWLESFLNSWPGAVVLISHDRTFLDKSVNRICDIHQGILHEYSGNYTSFTEQKALRVEQQLAAFRNQQKLIKETETFIERFRYKDSKASQVQSRVKMLNKLERMLPPVQQKHISVRIPQPGRSVRIVAEFSQVSKAYGDTQVFNRLNFQLERGQKIGLVGPNGAGKSTFLKMLAGVEPVSSGELSFGKDLRKTYFAQHQFEALPVEKSIFELMTSSVPTWTTTEIRSYLGSFMFSGDSVDKKISVLSGGEVSRLALAKMLAHPAHLILLDEPTNHLDIQSRDIVQDAIRSYEGSMVCISHDRHFLNAVTHSIIEIIAGELTVYPGNYEYYEWKKSRETSVSTGTLKKSDSSGSKKPEVQQGQRRKWSNRLKKLPELIQVCEDELSSVDLILADPANASDYEKIRQTLAKKERLEENFLDLIEEQEELQKKLM